QAQGAPGSSRDSGRSERVEGRSVWDGVYTVGQAKRGEAMYAEHCSRCHGATLMGGGEGVGPLIGATFSSNWNGVTLADMLERTRVSMPSDQPGNLTRQQTADVLAYVLSMNKFPPGKAELPRQLEILSQIRFLASKP
ncbi:MAG: c-type cytochrome, partial [Acidimicrobiia bacterium]